MDAKLSAAETKQRLLDRLDRFQGADALYREGGRVCRARVAAIDPGDKGLRAKFALVPTRGLDNGFSESWGIYSSWDTFGCGDDRWDAPYISLTVYFEPGLIEAVARYGETVVTEEYDATRFDAIGRCIRRYRKTKLAQRLTAELALVYEGRTIGTAANHVLGEYPEVTSTFSPTDLDPALAQALSDPHGGAAFSGPWWMQTAAGARLDISVPGIDLAAGTIQWRIRS